ncbi:Poly(R)-hydroxyalkanoic acid synthase subunit (PHA_synth_III_E) [Natronoarchaeum philippinense]|uniref:Poly(3-hydroxyalkanoate) polymerase subunit PhaE n=1 Tax=Natronoarchaeum philippinense TaxID=558529 RepID=A0A285NBP1_NATPI|nr:poly(R)-hydroxyalkanoic acid synthase subunit PhaE [Natronoarchaeum philippinense]SNZ05376.1 Poly(R)-hydroxyalkanoic acid synthase subunit (PHA_synth_III_E) [Natronoarchaeum philippinense]
MTDSTPTDSVQQNWGSFMEEMNEQFVEALEQNVEAQAEFVESWTETLEATTGDERLSEGVDGYAKAYQVWMDAAQEMVERTADVADGEQIDVEEFRDVWLNSANQAFKEVMSTSAFAAATGESVQDAMEVRQMADDSAEATLRQLRIPTQSDVEEIGDRLVELERRQHEVERKLDRVLEHLEE